ncbi:MAG: ComF family protein [Desulfosalsimonadaceae bacterium]
MSGWKTVFHQVKQGIASGLFPDICFSCNRFIEKDISGDSGKAPVDGKIPAPETSERIFRAVMAGYLCCFCMDDFVPVSPPICPRCGAQFRSRAGSDHLCGRCIARDMPGSRTRRIPFVSARAYGQYTGTLKNMIHAYKYHGKTGLGRPLGALLHIHFARHYADASIDCIIPVPLHREKLVKRGFDQVMGMLYHWPWTVADGSRVLENGSALSEKLLHRVKNTDTQTGLDRKRRSANVRNAFVVTDSERVKNKSVVLIDDVYTTGATLEECALAVERAGARQVHCLTLARAM